MLPFLLCNAGKFAFQDFCLRHLLFITLFIFSCADSFAQAVPDTSLSQTVPDTLARRKRAEAAQGLHVQSPAVIAAPFQPEPKRSGLLSAIIPGLGQAYNHQYWKIPVIYTGVAASAYFLSYNNHQYQTYRKAYIARIDSDPATTDDYTGIYTTDALKQLQDGYKKYLDLTVLLTGVGYMLQVMDAVVYAHLRNFDMSRNLSMKVAPVLAPGYTGIGIALNYH